MVLSFTFLAPNLHVKNILILHKIHYQLKIVFFSISIIGRQKSASVPPALRAEGHYAVPLQFWHFIVLIATACTQGILDLYDTLCKAGGTILSLLNRNNITSLNTN